MYFTYGAFHLSDVAGQARPGQSIRKENFNQNHPARLVYCDGL